MRCSAWLAPAATRAGSGPAAANPQEVAERILREMARGVTRIDGTGMYTGRERPMLLCAITITETSRLKALVAELDPEAMIIIIPAHAIYGKGFQSLS